MYQFFTNWSDWLKNTLLLDVNCLAAQKCFAETGCTKHENMSFMDISLFPFWFYWLGEEPRKSEFCRQLSRDGWDRQFQKGNVLQAPQTRVSALRTLPVWAEQKWVFLLFYPSLAQYRSSFLLSAKPVVWRPAHGSNDASCGQPGSPPAACFSDRCAGWKQPPKLGPGGILSNLSASSALVPTPSGDVGARVAQVGRTQARCPTSNSSLRRSAASVEIGVFGNELWLTLQVFLFLDGSWDWALVAATCCMPNGWFCFGV